MSSSLSRILASLAVASLVAAPAIAAKGKPLRTGQTTSYGAAGDTTAGIRRSVVDNGYGWIKDQRTGLMWEKKDDSSGVHGKRRTYSWSASGSNTATGTVFTSFLAELNTPPCFAGFCDWRLPTRFELDTITNLGAVGATSPTVEPLFDTACTSGCTIDECSCTSRNAYWTSSTLAEDPGQTWTVHFIDGSQPSYSKTMAQRARAVRNFR
jgi:hypothetical protein